MWICKRDNTPSHQQIPTHRMRQPLNRAHSDPSPRATRKEIRGQNARDHPGAESRGALGACKSWEQPQEPALRGVVWRGWCHLAGVCYGTLEGVLSPEIYRLLSLVVSAL